MLKPHPMVLGNLLQRYESLEAQVRDAGQASPSWCGSWLPSGWDRRNHSRKDSTSRVSASPTGVASISM